MNDFAASNEHESVNDSDPQPQAPSGSSLRRSPLRRAYRGRMLGGVAAGIGDYLGVDANIVRVAFAVLTLAGGAGIPVYIACLFLIPEEGTDTSLASSLLDSVQTR
jgi:phage shock protein C